MDAAVVRYFEGFDSKFLNFGSIALSLVVASLSAGVLLFLKYAFYRSKFSQVVPSRTMGFLDLLGSVSDILHVSRKKDISTNTYILQTLGGYNEMFKNHSFFLFWIGYVPFLCARKAEAVEEVISGSRNMKKSFMYSWLHPWLGTGLLTSFGAKWKSRRKLLTPSFHFEILKDFLPVFNEQSEVLVKVLEKETEKPWTDIVMPVTCCSLDIVCETTLGASVGAQTNSDSEYVKAVLRASEVLMTRMMIPYYWLDITFYLSKIGIQFRKDLKLLHKFTRSVIASKKEKLLRGEVLEKKKRKALMDVLLEHHVQNKTLTEEDIREEVDTFAFEGHDTTSMGISWALYMLGLYKDVQNRAHEEMDRIFGGDVEREMTMEDIKDMEYLDRVLKESQRLYPSVPMIGREISEDTVLGGNPIKKDTSCMILTYFLHRDEKVFPNPEKFDPDRFLPENTVGRHPYAYIPFSAGPRNCIGQRFAQMEEKVVVASILRNFTLESLDPRDKVLAAPELILRADTPIRMRIRPRRPQKG